MNKQNFLARLLDLSWPSEDPKKIKIRNQVYPKLKRGLRPKTRWYAYEVIQKYGGNVNSLEDIIIAGLFATHDKNISRGGNLGTLWKKIILKREESKDKPSALFHFNRLLACKNSEELCYRLIPIIHYAKAESIPVDYQNLYNDLTQFSNQKYREVIIRKWVQSYWRSND